MAAPAELEQQRILEAELRMLEAERARRLGGSDEQRRATIETVAALRARQAGHPKARAAAQSKALQVAILGGRRAGKTSEGNHEDLADAIETPRFRATYCNATKPEAMGLVWRSDTEDGWLDLLARHGRRDQGDTSKWHIGGVTAVVNEARLEILFSNGSKLDIFAADTPADLDKFRGRAKSRVRVDEVQKFPGLDRFVRSVCTPALKDFGGQLILQGSPGEDCAGYWYEITKPLEDGPRLPGWEVHELTVLDNPFFGASPEERFARVIQPELDDKGMSLDDPEIQREWFARWIRTGASHVYAVHAVPPDKLCYAPLRTSDSWRRYAPLVQGGVHREVLDALAGGWYDHEASVADLPRGNRRRTWLFGIGLDFGTDPDSFAIAVDGFTLDMPDVFEMWSWKRTLLVPDDWRVLVELLFLQLSGACVALVGDPAGMKGELKAWRERLGIPISEADKHGKEAWITSYNGDIRRGHRHYRKDSPLLDEQQHLLWLPTLPGQRRKAHKHRRLVDGRVPGDHCSDASLYLSRDLAAHAYRAPAPKEDRLAREERMYEAAAEQATQRRQAAVTMGAIDDDRDDWEPVRW